ncbi:MAG: hypothetical protein GC159_03105 [Phycisphaera sp.]|nr:hypothetical protein [Phycisphaera sp.]
MACALVAVAFVATLPAMLWAQAADDPANVEAPSAAAVSKPDPKALFDELFGGEVKRVTGTPDPADDLQLAKTLLDAAQNTADNPQLVAVLAEQAATLAAKSPEGGAVTDTALRLLIDKAPERRVELLKQLVDANQKAYLKTPIADRPAAGEKLIDTMLDLAAAQLAEDNPSDAILTYRRAGVIGTSIHTSRRDELKALLDEAVAAQRVQNQIDTARARVKANPQDKAAAAELVRLHIVELDDPTEARKYTFLIDDETMKTNIRLASGKQDDMTEDQFMALADWYKDLAPTAGALRSRATMYQHAADYYDAFLAKHTATDLVQTKATLERKRVGDQLAALTERLGPSALSVQRSSAWVDVLALVDPAKHARGPEAGQWTKDNNGVHSVSYAGTIVMPVTITGSYDLEMVTSHGESRNGRFSLEIPVGTTSTTLFVYSSADDLPNAFAFVNDQRVQDEANPTRFRYPMTEENHDYTVGIKVRVKGDNASLTVSIDGKGGVQWEGPLAQLTPRYDMGTGHNFNYLLYRQYGHIRSMKVRGVDGGKVAPLTDLPAVAVGRAANDEARGPRPTNPQVAQFLSQAQAAWQRATSEQRQVLVNQIRTQLQKMPETQREAFMFMLKRSDNDAARSLHKALKHDG